MVKYGNYGYLYGGNATGKLNDLSLINFQTFTWSPLKVKFEDFGVDKGKCGHTINFYQDKLICFGGQSGWNRILNQRLCYNDVMVYNLKTSI